MKEIVDAINKKHDKEIDDTIKQTDDKFHIKQFYTEKFAELEEHLKNQNNRLESVKKTILSEQDLVQKDYDQTFEQFEYLKQCLDKFESLNVRWKVSLANNFEKENLNDIFDREVNKESISVRDEYLYELYKLMKSCKE